MPRPILQSKRRLLALALCLGTSLSRTPADEPPKKPDAEQRPPVQLTAREDHQRLMELLQIKALRPGRTRTIRRLRMRSTTTNPRPTRTRAAGPARAQERDKSHDGGNVVRAAASGNRGRFRPGRLWPGPYAGFFPTDFTKLPTFSFVVPNLIDDMHDGTVSKAIPGSRTMLRPIGNGQIHTTAYSSSPGMKTAAATTRSLRFSMGKWSNPVSITSISIISAFCEPLKICTDCLMRAPVPRPRRFQISLSARART